MKKKMLIFVAIVAPSTVTMIVGGVHPGWITANVLWFVVLAVAHRLWQD